MIRKFLILRDYVETSIQLHGSWLVLIGNVQINFGVIWHFVLASFSYLADNQECWNLNTKVNTNYVVSSW